MYIIVLFTFKNNIFVLSSFILLIKYLPVKRQNNDTKFNEKYYVYVNKFNVNVY